MLAWINVSGLGAAIPHLIRTADTAEILLMQAVAVESLRLKAKAKGAL